MSALPASSASAIQRSIGSRSEILDDDRARSNFPRWHHRCRLQTMSTRPQLETTILRSVSRSFYLSIRLLPAKLREPIALAYLLARATDTIADTAEIEATLRLKHLGRLAALIQGDDLSEEFSDFAVRQTNPAERTLMESVPLCLAWLRAISPNEQKEIRDVLLRINEGQSLDVQRFGDAAQITALETAADLDRYTYLVAGCVGEFWTNICFLHLPRFSTKSGEEMVSLGVSYGKSLQ